MKISKSRRELTCEEAARYSTFENHGREGELKTASLSLLAEEMNWDADKTAALKWAALGKEVRQITEEAITKVINAGIALFIVGDLSDAEAIREIEDCLEKIKKEIDECDK